MASSTVNVTGVDFICVPTRNFEKSSDFVTVQIAAGSDGLGTNVVMCRAVRCRGRSLRRWSPSRRR